MKQLATILIIFYFLYVSASHATEHKTTTIISHNSINAYTMIKEGQSLLKEGDLVVRLNRDPASWFIKNFNQHDKSFSHSGIVLYENGYPCVFHVINGEGNENNTLRKDSFSSFCDPRKNAAYGIFRYNITEPEIKKLKDCIHQWYAQGVKFDFRFNLASDDSMYCSEMISKALAKATNKRILIETTKLTAEQAALFSGYTHLPLSYTGKLPIVPIDNLYINPFCHPVKEYNYKRK